MKLKFRYENDYQIIELDDAAAKQLWVSLELEDEGLTDEEKKERMQEAVDVRFNRPEYNIYHRETRHIDPNPKKRRFDGRPGFIQSVPGEKGFDVMHYLAVTSEEEKIAEKFAYEDICAWVRESLADKPEWAEAFIAVRLDGEKTRDYAKRKGVSENSITQKLRRAEKKLRERYPERKI